MGSAAGIGRNRLLLGKRLYVGNLPFEVDSYQLQCIFSGVGEVESVSVVEDRDSGRSRGYAFVEMSTPEEAARAIELLNGAKVPDHSRYGTEVAAV